MSCPRGNGRGVSMSYREEDYLMLSGIQHFAYCRRQWALIHIEQVWCENFLTAAGQAMHEQVHGEARSFEKRGTTLITRALPVSSAKLGLSGVCDVVEFKLDAEGITLFGQKGTYRVEPIEYKRGSPKNNDADVVQVAAQAMCLEEMLCCKVPAVTLFYGNNRRRVSVALDAALRERVTALALEMHRYAARRYTPAARYRADKCKACSLLDICMPKLSENKKLSGYFAAHLPTEKRDEEVTEHTVCDH